MKLITILLQFEKKLKKILFNMNLANLGLFLFMKNPLYLSKSYFSSQKLAKIW